MCECQQRWAEGDLNDYFMQTNGGGTGKGNGKTYFSHISHKLSTVDSVKNVALTNSHISGQVYSGFLTHTGGFFMDKLLKCLQMRDEGTWP